MQHCKKIFLNIAKEKEKKKEHPRIPQHTFFPNKRQGPGENIHEIWKPIWMRRTIELPDIHDIVLILQYCS